MKKVFSGNAECIHMFAQQTQDEGRTPNGNVFFEGKKLYSYGYHYLLCEFVNENTVVINDEGYSQSTSRHINITFGATSQYKQFRKTQTDLDYIHSHVMNYVKPKLAKARKPEMYINEILSLWASLNEFLEYTKAKKYKSKPKYRELKRIFTALNDSSEEYQQKLREAANKADKARKRKEAKELKEKLVKFENYETDYFRAGSEDFLRLSKDGERVETSQQVSVSRENAKMLYELIKRGVDIKGRHIEHYIVTSINGTLKIGCHNINMESVHKVGEQL